MEKQKRTFKEWREDNKDLIDKIAGVVYIAGFIGLGYVVGGRITELSVDNGLERCHNLGIIKFFNPSTGLEVNPNEALNVMKEFVNK